MLNSVHIPESVKDIKNAIARRITILAEWQALLAKSRKPSLRNSRQLQVNATKAQIALLRETLANAQKQAEIKRAKAVGASLASVRRDWEHGLFN